MKHRPLSTIAQEIERSWVNVYFAARPYLSAMHQLHHVDDMYYNEDGRDIVLYFLSNASTWRGEKAREIKAELKEIMMI